MMPGKIPRAGLSLFGEILKWMLLPLLVLWPVSVFVVYDVASYVANQPYDKALADQVRALSHLVYVGPKSVFEGAPLQDSLQVEGELQRGDDEDVSYQQVSNRSGAILAGSSQLPVVVPDGVPGQIQFRNEQVEGREVRIASMVLTYDGGMKPEQRVMVQAGETLHQRNVLKFQIFSGVLLPQFVIFLLAVVLAWYGLSRGLAPLDALCAHIRARRPGNLSPMPVANAPEEVRPVVEAFNSMMAQLENSLHAQRRFIADAAHQMRTPIAGLKMQAELALQDAAQIPAAPHLHSAMLRVMSGAERATRLIQQLLALARAEAEGEKPPAFERLNLNALVCEVAAEFVPQALDRNIDLGVDLNSHIGNSELSLWVNASPVLLRELVANLVDNAIKYTSHNGHVTLETRLENKPEGQQVVLVVCDNGSGVPQAERERVFERFYRVLGSGVEGSGLGLPIVREVAELHGGHVRLQDVKHGNGICACVTLPWGGEGGVGG